MYVQFEVVFYFVLYLYNINVVRSLCMFFHAYLYTVYMYEQSKHNKVWHELVELSIFR